MTVVQGYSQRIIMLRNLRWKEKEYFARKQAERRNREYSNEKETTEIGSIAGGGYVSKWFKYNMRYERNAFSAGKLNEETIFESVFYKRDSNGNIVLYEDKDYFLNQNNYWNKTGNIYITKTGNDFYQLVAGAFIELLNNNVVVGFVPWVSDTGIPSEAMELQIYFPKNYKYIASTIALNIVNYITFNAQYKLYITENYNVLDGFNLREYKRHPRAYEVLFNPSNYSVQGTKNVGGGKTTPGLSLIHEMTHAVYYDHIPFSTSEKGRREAEAWAIAIQNAVGYQLYQSAMWVHGNARWAQAEYGGKYLSFRTDGSKRDRVSPGNGSYGEFDETHYARTMPTEYTTKKANGGKTDLEYLNFLIRTIQNAFMR